MSLTFLCKYGAFFEMHMFEGFYRIKDFRVMYEYANNSENFLEESITSWLELSINCGWLLMFFVVVGIAGF